MGRDVFEASTAAREVFEEADSALGFSLSRLCFEGPAEELQLTENQQPAILATSIALLRALEEKVEIAPSYVAGHSLGEYSALVAAGALSLDEAVRLVHARGQFMQEAVPEGRGAMSAIMGCGPEVALEACESTARSLGQVVSPANYNSPLQTVIAGEADAVLAAGHKAIELGAKKAIALSVSAPFHCALMEPAAEKLESELANVQFRDSRIPVVTNVEAKANSEAARMPGLLRSQVTAPVRFTDMVAEFANLGVEGYLEVGPGRVLSGLLARIQRRVARANFGALEDLDSVKTFVSERES